MALVFETIRAELGAFALTADFTVPAGSKVAIIGPSGAGKSTLLSLLAGFLRPATGRLLWEGRDLAGLPPAERPVSILFQDNNLFPHLSVFQNVALGVNPSLRLSDAERARVRETLASVGLGAFEARKPGALSGGQQSRVALARVILRARPLMLLDEPFAALGPALRAEMLESVKEVAEASGATVLMVTHDPQDAIRLGGDTIFVDAGTAAAPVDTEALLANPPAALSAYL